MLDLKVIQRPEEKPKPPKRVTHSVKETGLIGGRHLVMLTAMVEHGPLCRRKAAQVTDFRLEICSALLSDLVRHELAYKTGEKIEGRTLYAAKERN